MKHIFDIEIAKIYGVNAAILLENIGYWIKQNEANNTNFYDGYHWTFNSRRAYREIFPYMSERQIDTAFHKLIDDGLIVTGHYNKLAYDRTLWYALTEKGKCILHFDGMESGDLQNANNQNVETIPNINADVSTDKNTDEKKKYVSAIVDYLNKAAGTNYKASTKATARHIEARLKEGFCVSNFFAVIDKKVAEWKGTEMEKYLRPETLFGTKFEGYLNARTAGNKRGANGVLMDNRHGDELDVIL